MSCMRPSRVHTGASPAPRAIPTAASHMPLANTIPRPPSAAPEAPGSGGAVHARRELAAFLAVATAFVVTARSQAWFEDFHHWSHDHWAISELILCAASFTAVGGIFVARRWSEMRRAVARREQAERELAATRTRHQHLLDASPVVTFALTRVDGEVSPTWITGNLERLFGYAPGEVVSREWWLDRVHPDDRAGALRAADEAFAAARASHEFRFRDAGGEYRRVIEDLRRIPGAGGAPARVVGSWTDITELHERETRYQLVVESASDAIVSVDRAGTIVFANPAAERIFGYTPAELAGMPLHRLMPERMREAHGASFAAHARTGVRTFPWERVEFPGLHRSGREVPLELSFGAPDGGRFITAVIRDLTERDRATAELRGAERRAQRVAQRMKALATAGSGVIAAQSIEELRAAIHDACQGVIPFDTLHLARYDPERDTLFYVGAVDDGTWDEPVEVTVRGRPTARVIDERRSTLTLSSDDPAAAGSHLSPNGRRSESTIRAPVLTAGGVAGLLSVQSYQRDAYDAEDVEVLETLAALAAPALLNLQLLAELRTSESALRESEARFRLVIDSLGEALLITNLDEEIQYSNPRASELLGYTRDELTGSVARELFAQPETRGRMRHRLAERRAGVSGRYELPVRHRDGGVVWSEVVASPLRNSAGDVVGTVAAISDITERRRAGLEAREARAQAERMAERMAAVAQAASGFMGVGSAVELRDVLRDACTGVLPCDALTFGVYDEAAGYLHFLGDFDGDTVFHPQSVPLAGTPSERVLRERRTLVTLRSTDPAGDGATLIGTGRRSESIIRTPILDGDRAVAVIAVQSYTPDLYTAHDVEVLETVAALAATALRNLRLMAERRASETALRESEALFRAVFNDAVMGISLGDFTGCILEANPALQAMVGRTADELRGTRWADITHPDDRDGSAVAFDTVAGSAAGHATVEQRYLRADGRVVWAQVTVSPIHGDDGKPRYVLVMVEDVTNRRDAEAALVESQRQLVQAQKMEAIGQLAGGVAHDFNNMLTAIRGNADLLLLDTPGADPRRVELEEIRRAADRSAELTRQLLAFSRQQMLQPRVLDLNESVAAMERMLRRLIGEDVELATSLEPALGRVRADPGQVEQVLLNLAVNARDAMPEGGTLRIHTRNVHVDAGDPRLEDGGEPGRFVHLAVHDNGTGMDDETVARIWEPFFTTKEQGKGTGLGLSTVYGIVRQSGGMLWAESAPGEGTVMNVLLPWVDAEVEQEATAGEGAWLAARGSETVLVVEDEQAVRRLATRVLTRSGFRVVEAADPAEALRLFDEHLGSIDMVLTDMVMPGMDGGRLAELLRERCPGLRVLYTTGYSAETLTPGRFDDREILPKPFAPDALIRRVREVLDGRE